MMATYLSESSGKRRLMNPCLRQYSAASQATSADKASIIGHSRYLDLGVSSDYQARGVVLTHRATREKTIIDDVFWTLLHTYIHPRTRFFLTVGAGAFIHTACHTTEARRRQIPR